MSGKGCSLLTTHDSRLTKMKTHRLARVSEVIREVASETILFELHDPRVKGVTVTRAEVSADLQRAKVFVSVMGTEAAQELCMHGLRNSAGFVQRKLGSRLKTRFTPTITFILDQGVKNSIEMTRLINEALAQGSSPPFEGGGAEGMAEESVDHEARKEDS